MLRKDAVQHAGKRLQRTLHLHRMIQREVWMIVPHRPISYERSSRVFGASFLIFASLLSGSQLALAQFSQQGPKLVGTGAIGGAEQGVSAALSGDGNTAIVGGLSDNSGTGAVWVYSRSRQGLWTQDSKLVGTGSVESPQQGYSAALSGDGNTAIVGGYTDNTNTGAAWVYTRRGNFWTQQGSKLVGTGAIGNTNQGTSVALSADGNTAIVGGYGAVWVYTRSRQGLWTQQGGNLVGTGGVTDHSLGSSVALSGDGNTALVGGPNDNSGIGAAWVYVRRGGVWTQQGSKLVGTDAVGLPQQGWSVALSSDGHTALVGGINDNDGYPGAAWVYSRRGGVWTQQGSKLVGTDAVGQSEQGHSVALSADGNTALVGGQADNGGIGAVWAYTRSRQGLWTQQGNKLVGTGAVGTAGQGAAVALSGDGNAALVGGPGDNSEAPQYHIGAAWVFVWRTKDDCKDGGWRSFISSPGPFKNQGQCVSYFEERREAEQEDNRKEERDN
jgi:hypothetical protein